MCTYSYVINCYLSFTHFTTLSDCIWTYEGKQRACSALISLQVLCTICTIINTLSPNKIPNFCGRSQNPFGFIRSHTWVVVSLFAAMSDKEEEDYESGSSEGEEEPNMAGLLAGKYDDSDDDDESFASGSEEEDEDFSDGEEEDAEDVEDEEPTTVFTTMTGKSSTKRKTDEPLGTDAGEETSKGSSKAAKHVSKGDDKKEEEVTETTD